MGIEDAGQKSSVKVYPNPVGIVLHIEMGKIYEETDVRVLNILGKEVIHKGFEKEQLIRINIAKLSAGPYFVQIQTAKENVVLSVVRSE